MLRMHGPGAQISTIPARLVWNPQPREDNPPLIVSREIPNSSPVSGHSFAIQHGLRVGTANGNAKVCPQAEQ